LIILWVYILLISKPCRHCSLVGAYLNETITNRYALCMHIASNDWRDACNYIWTRALAGYNL